MSIFVDTSALYALFTTEDQNHAATVACLEELQTSRTSLVSTNYVLLECAALMQRRQGFARASMAIKRMVEMLDILWVGEKEHRDAVELWVKNGRKTLSLVDCSSAAMMHRHHIMTMVAFDADFRQMGLDIIPRRDRVSDHQIRYTASRSRR